MVSDTVRTCLLVVVPGCRSERSEEDAGLILAECVQSLFPLNAGLESRATPPFDLMESKVMWTLVILSPWE